jgi:uncharacterized protein HemX
VVANVYKQGKGAEGMASNVTARNYRLRQAPIKAGRRKSSLFNVTVSGEVRRVMAIMVAIALVMGLAITQFFHGRVVDTKASVIQLQSKNAAVSNENIRLLAARAQLTSKAKIVSHAGTKLNLFEPEKGQVHRM